MSSRLELELALGFLRTVDRETLKTMLEELARLHPAKAANIVDILSDALSDLVTLADPVGLRGRRPASGADPSAPHPESEPETGQERA